MIKSLFLALFMVLSVVIPVYAQEDPTINCESIELISEDQAWCDAQEDEELLNEKVEEIITEEPQPEPEVLVEEKGVPSPETVAGNEKIVPQTSVLGANTTSNTDTVSPKVLSETGASSLKLILVGLSVVVIVAGLARIKLKE